MTDTAKLFWSGRSQAVRLPAAYRMDGDAVQIRRVAGGLLLEPVPTDWSWLADVVGDVDPSFETAALDQPPSAAPPALNP